MIEATLALLDLDAEALLADLTRAVERGAAEAPQPVTFAIPPAALPLVEAALAAAAVGLEGKNRRGRALVAICRASLEAHDG